MAARFVSARCFGGVPSAALRSGARPEHYVNK
jgi:hypothetical protein